MKWPNILRLSELLFSLPFSTAKVERFFSTFKVIKNEKRTNLSRSTLNDLLEVKTEGPSFGNFSADAALELWWKDSTGRRVNQKPRKEYRRCEGSSTHVARDSQSEDESSEIELDLDTWDSWFCEGVVQDPASPFDSSDSD